MKVAHVRRTKRYTRGKSSSSRHIVVVKGMSEAYGGLDGLHGYGGKNGHGGIGNKLVQGQYLS